MSMTLIRMFPAIFVAVATLSAHGQTAVIDTAAGRITCELFTKERPVTVARFVGLAEGTMPWTAPDGVVVNGKPFYDGTRIDPNTAGIVAGTRATASEKAAGEGVAVETEPERLFDRAGLLAMLISKGKAGPSRFLITDHANREVNKRAVVFGACDAASVALVTRLRAELQKTDNHPATPFVINHIAIVREGNAKPSVAGAVGVVLPALSGGPLAARAGPEPTGPNAVLDTSAGKIVCRLFTKESPIATGVFVGLVNGTKEWTDPRTHAVRKGKRFYDGMAIDRVLPDFYIQFGDITGDISGKVDIGFRFDNENTPDLTFDRPGRLAFGNAGPNTNNSELFFALNPVHALDGGYTIVGQCDEASVAVLDRIAHMPRDGANLPLTPVVIRRIAIEAAN